MSGSELIGKPVAEILEWLFPLFDDLTQVLCSAITRQLYDLF